MIVDVQRRSLPVLADASVKMTLSPLVLEWPHSLSPRHHASILLPALQYLLFQLFFIRSIIDQGIDVKFPEYENCREDIRQWERNGAAVPTLRHLLDRLFEPRPKYVTDFKAYGRHALITLHFREPFQEPRKKDIWAFQGGDGEKLLNLYQKPGCVPIFSEPVLNSVCVILSCGQLAFKNEIDAILHQQLVIVDEHEEALTGR